MTSFSQLDTQTPRTPTLTPNMQENVVAVNSIWGRLYSTISYLEPIDLSKPTFTFGRCKDSDVVITANSFPSTKVLNISKLHFTIIREPNCPIYIKDLSKNGTFLNGKVIGKGNQNILANDDEIAVGTDTMKVYVFKIIQDKEHSYLPHPLCNKYTVSRILGNGACGEVRLIFDKCICKAFAVKRIIKSINSNDNKLNHPSKILNEVNILKSLSHPFVISVEEIVETKDAVFIILEYMEGGELSTFIKNGLSENQCKYLFYQMVLAVQYLHSQGVTHRDLKPENVLLKDFNTLSLVKITDFGLSKIIDEETAMRTVCGTLTYVAPEIIDKNRTGCYGQAVDVWSLGVILYYMLSQEMPFKCEERNALMSMIINGKYNLNTQKWQNISKSAKDLVTGMLTVNPSKRIKTDDIIEHSWINSDFEIKQRVHKLMYELDGTLILESVSETDIAPKRIKLSEIGNEQTV